VQSPNCYRASPNETRALSGFLPNRAKFMIHSRFGSYIICSHFRERSRESLINNDHVKFLSAFVRKPILTGAIAPSSRWLGRRMTENMGLERAETVVELGPGTGPFTRAILEVINRKALFLAVEINPEFASKLTAQFPQVVVINDSAEKLEQYLAQYQRAKADSILCGLPWAGFPRDLQDRLLSAVLKSLRPGGKFATFAYCHGLLLPPGQRFRRLLKDNFARVETTRVVWRNMPPAFVYRCER